MREQEIQMLLPVPQVCFRFSPLVQELQERTVNISTERGRCLVYEQYDPDGELTFEMTEQTDTLRWNSVHVLVVKDTRDRYWETTYQQGLTENQDERAFEYDTVVEFREVRRVPVITYEFVPVEGLAPLAQRTERSASIGRVQGPNP